MISTSTTKRLVSMSCVKILGERWLITNNRLLIYDKWSVAIYGGAKSSPPIQRRGLQEWLVDQVKFETRGHIWGLLPTFFSFDSHFGQVKFGFQKFCYERAQISRFPWFGLSHSRTFGRKFRQTKLAENSDIVIIDRKDFSALSYYRPCVSTDRSSRCRENLQ